MMLGMSDGAPISCPAGQTPIQSQSSLSPQQWSCVDLSSAPPATAVASSPAAVTWAYLDQLAAQFTSNVTQISQWSTDGLAAICPYCADPATALSQYLANTGASLSPGITASSVISRYSSQISGWCAAIQAEATKRGLTGACGASSSGFSLSGLSPILLVGGALLAAALLMGDN